MSNNLWPCSPICIPVSYGLHLPAKRSVDRNFINFDVYTVGPKKMQKYTALLACEHDRRNIILVFISSSATPTNIYNFLAEIENSACMWKVEWPPHPPTTSIAVNYFVVRTKAPKLT